MSVLPNPSTGDSGIDYLFQRIDECLSELYSIHGTQTPRGGTKVVTATSIEGDGSLPLSLDRLGKGVRLGKDSIAGPYSKINFRPQRGSLYRESIAKAWAHNNGLTAPYLTAGFNLSVTHTGVGQWTYRFNTPMLQLDASGVEASYSVVATSEGDQLPNVFKVCEIMHVPTPTAIQFRVIHKIVNTVAGTAALVDLPHDLVVFGLQ